MPQLHPPRPEHAVVPALLLATLIAVGSSACLLQKKPGPVNPLAAVKSEQPDKLLYDIAMKDLSKGKYLVARLNLETLLNTYPNSEYLAQAKLAVANSWYRQGGVDGYAQAEAQYKDFITFFPAMKEAAEAQLRIAQIHYRQLQKPDRDPTQAEAAQAALRIFLMNYPDSTLRPQALQMLRATQEVLAERIYRIGEYYLDRAHQGAYSDYRAAQDRLLEAQVRFPLYSQGDMVADELGHSYAATSRLYRDASTLERIPADKALYAANAKADEANALQQFNHLIERYPMSPLAKDAKVQLAALHAPIPTPTAEAIAFNKEEIGGREKAPNPGNLDGWFGLKAMWSGRPASEIARADKVGTPPVVAAQLAEAAPVPGLQELIHNTMVASGAIPATAQISAALSEAKKVASATAASDPNPAEAQARPAPLEFQNLPAAKARGADTQPTDTPQAMTGNNFSDPNATPDAPAIAPSVVLTPNELDMETQDEILADGIHRNVPAPLAELKKGLKLQEQREMKLLQAIRKVEQQREQRAKPAAPATTPAPGASKSGGGSGL
ncbi:MAG: outer membrane protein assembly factor BamD [Terriglobales bacterium]